MKREWKPGDVAMRVSTIGASLIATRVARCQALSNLADEPHWHFVSPKTPRLVGELRQCGIGQMLMDRDAARSGTTVDAEFFTNVSNALRSLIEPPKPEEPTNPKTRVTDRRENVWRLLADGDWVCTSGPDIGEYLNWDQLAGDRGPVSIEGDSHV